MDRFFFLLLTLALQWYRPRYDAQLQLLTAQLRMLRKNNDELDESFRSQAEGAVPCRQQLRGIIKSYYRDAA